MSNGSQTFGAEGRGRPGLARALRRIALGSAAVLLPTGSLVAAWFYASLWLPTGSQAVPGLDGGAEIVHDSHGVPHISARSTADGAFALGYVHARDRLWQMEMQRRLAAGRLAEIFGSAALESDRFMRTLGLAGLVERDLEGLTPEVKAQLDAYAAGVNAWLRRPLAVLPPEFALTMHSPEPWRATDSLLWGKLMALRLGTNWRTELLRARLSAKLTPEQMADLWPGDAKIPQRPVEGMADLAPLFARLWTALPAPPAVSAAGQASNAWIIGPAHSASGKPLLANDPHLGFGAPILWYLARVSTPEGELTGATVPGVPFHILGHNGKAAWGMTATGSDTQDLFVERLAAGDPDRYETPEGGAAFTIRRERIQVRGGADQTLRVRVGRHGPVISDLVPFPETTAGPHHVVALQAAALAEGDRTVQALAGMNRAVSWETFREALKDFHVPQQNVFYADGTGTIAFMAPGRVPLRKSGTGSLPQPGWSGAFDWTGWVPFEELPQAVNPPGGRLVNANNRIVGPDYPHHLSDDWPADYRARRIWDMLAEAPVQNADTAVRIQMDVEDIAARELLPLMLAFEPSTLAGRKVVNVLKHWNHDMLARRAEPLLFETWMRELNRALLADKLGPLFDYHWGSHPRFLRKVLTERPQWCDDAATPAVENCAARLDRSLNAAIDKLTAEFGANPLRWRWGNSHRARFAHPLAGRGPFPRNFWSPVVETDGGDHTVNRGTSRIEDPHRPYEHVHGAGLRVIYDLADLPNTRFMIATGQSGHPFSPHYDDLIKSWREGRYLRLSNNLVDLADSQGARLTLIKASHPAAPARPAPRLWEIEPPKAPVPLVPSSPPPPVEAAPSPASPVHKRPEQPLGNPLPRLLDHITSLFKGEPAKAPTPPPEPETTDEPPSAPEPPPPVAPHDATQEAPQPNPDSGLAPIEAPPESDGQK